jgi:hypothetical protein
MKKTFILMVIFLFLLVPSITFAASNKSVFATVEQVQQMITDALSSLQARVTTLENKSTSSKRVLEVKAVRGAFWENTNTIINVETPDHVTINCSVNCLLWVNYDVDTRNTSASTATPYQHLYFIYVDGVDQAVFNQATMIFPGGATPLAVNGTFPASAGSHTVSIYARSYGGTMQSFESHLQVMAIEQ